MARKVAYWFGYRDLSMYLPFILKHPTDISLNTSYLALHGDLQTSLGADDVDPKSHHILPHAEQRYTN